MLRKIVDFAKKILWTEPMVSTVNTLKDAMRAWAQIKLPDGTIVQGKVDNWTDYEGDQLQITIDGTTYLVHAANAIMKT